MSISSSLPSLLLTRPHRQISYNLEPLGINAPLGEVLERKKPFALYHTNRKLTLEPKVKRTATTVPSSPAPPPALANGKEIKSGLPLQQLLGTYEHWPVACFKTMVMRIYMSISLL